MYINLGEQSIESARRKSLNDPVSTYANNTRKSGDMLRRFSHNARFKLGLSLVDPPPGGSVLDFGGGDGAFLELLHKASNRYLDLVLFEPFMDVPTLKNFTHYKSWDLVRSHISNKRFDVVFCQEVMEHFSSKRQIEALSNIASVLSINGFLIISVPVEIGPVAIIKNVGRWKHRNNSAEIYSYSNLLKSFFSLPVNYDRGGDGFLSHMGFYYKDLQNIMSKEFVIERILGSPFPWLPITLNSQVFYVARRRN